MSLKEHDPFFTKIPHEVASFISSKVVVGELALPYHYPCTDELEAWQVGYRTDGRTGESLVSTTQGAWQKTWYVIARNYFDDPFFIDISEGADNFPVYYAPHGAGHWEASIIAPNIQRFSQILTTLCALEEQHAEALLWIAAETDLSLPFWCEVHEERCNRQRECEEEAAQTALEDDLITRHSSDT